jgi:hypothetical protein
MPPQFKNMNELIEYLGVIEQRLIVLEAENKQLRILVPPNAGADGNMISKYISRALPKTNLFSSSFLKRAFAVWGHFFVANLIIGTTFGVIYFCFVIVLFGSLFRNISK